MNSYHIAIDIGAGSGRAVVGRINKEKLIEVSELHRFSTQNIIVNGNKLIDIYQIYKEILIALDLFNKNYKADLGSIGIDSWSTDFGILDNNGNLLGLPFFYRDNRTEGIDRIVNKNLGKKDLHLLTGGRSDSCSTLHQVLSMTWNNDPSIESGDQILFLGDLLNYFLSGIKKSEYSVASYSQMFNMNEGCWENKIFDVFNIPRRLQPEIIYPGDIVGPIHIDILKETGLSGTPQVIAPSVHDTASAALAVPFMDKCAFISSGTWSLVGIALDSPKISQQSYDAQISSTGMGFNKTLFKKNIVGLWIAQQCQRFWEREGIELSYEKMDKLTEQSIPHLAYIDSDDPSFFRPDNMIEAIQQYLKKTGQNEVASDDFGQILRIIYESMAMKYRQSIELIESVCEFKFEKISIVGGGSKIGLINEFTASVTDLTVFAGPNEASSVGNIMMQAFGMGEVSDEFEIKEIIKNSFEIKQYFPKDQIEWNEAYGEYRRICHISSPSLTK